MRLLSHVLGLAAGGLAVGVTLGGLSGALTGESDWPWLAVVAGVLVGAYGFSDLGLLRLPAAGRKWQVPRVWQTELPPTATFFMYGILLGVGFLTIAPYAAFTAVLVLELVARSAVWGGLIGAAYGLGRGTAFIAGVAIASRTVGDYQLVRTVSDRLVDWRRVLGVGALTVAFIEIARTAL